MVTTGDWWPPTSRGSSCPWPVTWHQPMSAPGSDHSLPLLLLSSYLHGDSAITATSAYPFLSKCHKSQWYSNWLLYPLPSIPIFSHRLKHFKAAIQIDDASDKLAADLIERLCLCVARAGLSRARTCIPGVKPPTGGCEVSVCCECFCPNN